MLIEVLDLGFGLPFKPERKEIGSYNTEAPKSLVDKAHIH